MIRRRYRLIRALELAVLGVLMTIAAFALERRLAGRLRGGPGAVNAIGRRRPPRSGRPPPWRRRSAGRPA